MSSTPTAQDLETLSRQLGRPVRDVVEIPARCVCGNPLVATTAPRLSNGIPFPTTYYLTHPVATAAVSRQENASVMVEMTERLANDDALAAEYRAAHENYLAERARIGEISGVGDVPEIDGISAGGMPNRVKCLHVLAGHSLAVGPGINPLGDEVLELISGEFDQDVCRCEGAWDEIGPTPEKDLSRHTRRLRAAGKTNPIKHRPGTGPVATIDCGTNSIRLLIAHRAETGLEDVERLMRIVRLGEGVDATGEFSPAALERTFEAADEFAEVIKKHQAAPVRFVATSASRDVSNRDEFVAGIRQRLNVTPEVVSGSEEAQLTFSGAVSALTDQQRADFAQAAGRDSLNVAVVDLGGGSTEVVVGTVDAQTAEATVDAEVSMDFGCVRFTERHFHSNPPTAAEMSAADADLDKIFNDLTHELDLKSLDVLIGVAGTITTITASALGLETYDSEKIHGATLPVNQVIEAAHRLRAMTREERGELGFMHPGRVDVIGAGSHIWAYLVERISTTAGLDYVVTSEKDILDGIALSLKAH